MALRQSNGMSKSGSIGTFPLGITSCGQRSEWREFAFALRQILDAIEPDLRLTHVLAQWNRLATALAESNRKREAQNRHLK